MYGIILAVVEVIIKYSIYHFTLKKLNIIIFYKIR